MTIQELYKIKEGIAKELNYENWPTFLLDMVDRDMKKVNLIDHAVNRCILTQANDVISFEKAKAKDQPDGYLIEVIKKDHELLKEIKANIRDHLKDQGYAE